MEKIKEIDFQPKKESIHGELAQKVYCECDFCEKRVLFDISERKVCENLSGDRFYCTFCIRHRFNTKNNRDVLMLSFRAIISAYYHYFYRSKRKMYKSEIKDFIQSHIQTGLSNPLFIYDQETMVWHIDFSRVGKQKKKVKIDNILQTITNILVCFNLPLCFKNCDTGKLYKKYEEAIMRFYASRWRPDGRRLLNPSLRDVVYLPKDLKESLPAAFFQ